MSMHLLGPAFQDIGGSKKKPNAKHKKAQAEHDAWLRKNNIHPEQLAARKKPAAKLVVPTPNTQPQPECSNGFAAGGFKKSVFDSAWQHTYQDDPEMAARESAALVEARAKTKRIAPAYSKGAYQYITPALSLQDIGKKK